MGLPEDMINLPWDLEEKVKQFVESWVQEGTPTKYVFFQNVGIDGIEVDLFMTEFAEKFEVNMDDFSLPKYATEDGDLLNWPKLLFLTVFKPWKLPYLSFSVQHLIEVAKVKKWFDPL